MNAIDEESRMNDQPEPTPTAPVLRPGVGGAYRIGEDGQPVLIERTDAPPAAPDPDNA